MIFLHPIYFVLLIPILFILIILYFNYWKNTNFWPLADLKIIFKSNSKYFKIYYILIFLIFVIFISIFSKPVKENILEKNNKNWIDIQIVLDVSYSMIAKDLKPDRLSVAKDVISLFLDKIESDRVWIIVFAWKTFTSLPLSFDYNIIKKITSEISVETINQRYMNMQGTAVWDAIILATDSFWDTNREKVIILVTDWEANKWVDPIMSLNYINESYDSNLKIYTIWIWWDDETFITIKDNFWRNINVPIAWVDEETLKTIAKRTNGKYFRAWSRDDLENIFLEISKLEKREIESDLVKVNIVKYDYFIYLLVIVFLWFVWIKYLKRF